MRGYLLIFWKLLAFKILSLVGCDVFLLHSVKEREEEDGDGCCALDIQEFGCRETSVLTMSLSRKVSFHDEAWLSGRIGRALVSVWSVRLVFDQIGPGWSWGSVLFLIVCMTRERRACLMMVLISCLAVCTHVECCDFAGRQLERGMGVFPGSLLTSCFVCLRYEFIFGVTGLGVGIITVLQASFCSPWHDLQFWRFSESSRYHRPPGSGGLFV